MSKSAKKQPTVSSATPTPTAKPSQQLTSDTKTRNANSNSKQSQVIAMLQAPTGATITAMMKSTGWQQHSVRGFLAGVVRKRLKLKLSSTKVDGNRIYRILGRSNGKSVVRRYQAAGHTDHHAARQGRCGTAGPEYTRRRDRTLARSRRPRPPSPLAYRLSAEAALSPAPSSSVSCLGLSASSRSIGRPGCRKQAPARSLGVSRDISERTP